MHAEFELQVRMIFSVLRNQAEREAYVLAIIGNEALIEYTMPHESTTLNIVPNPYNRETSGYKTVSYRKVHTKWLEVMTANNISWVGHPQGSVRWVTRHGIGHAEVFKFTPTARQLLEDRRNK